MVKTASCGVVESKTSHNRQSLSAPLSGGKPSDSLQSNSLVRRSSIVIIGSTHTTLNTSNTCISISPFNLSKALGAMDYCKASGSNLGFSLYLKDSLWCRLNHQPRLKDSPLYPLSFSPMTRCEQRPLLSKSNGHPSSFSAIDKTPSKHNIQP